MPVERLILAAAAGLAGVAVGAGLALTLDRLYSSPPDESVRRSRRARLLLLCPSGGLFWAAAALRAADVRQFALMALFGTILLALTATDFESHLLPNRIMYPSLVVALLLSWTWPGRALLSGLGGGAAGGATVLAVFLILPGFGFGDVKLGGLIGLVLGFPAVFTGLLIGVLLGGAGAGWMMLTRRAKLGTAIAYGPYLAGGAMLEMLLVGLSLGH